MNADLGITCSCRPRATIGFTGQLDEQVITDHRGDCRGPWAPVGVGIAPDVDHDDDLPPRVDWGAQRRTWQQLNRRRGRRTRAN